MTHNQDAAAAGDDERTRHWDGSLGRIMLDELTIMTPDYANRLERRAALVTPLVEALLARCEDHQHPLVENPRENGLYPLSGFYHELHREPDPHNPSGIMYGVCRLTDDERALIDAASKE